MLLPLLIIFYHTNMEKLQLYRKRARHLHYAFVAFLSLIYLSCLPLYPFFSVPVPAHLFQFMTFFVIALSLFSILPAYLFRKRLFPVNSRNDLYWSYTATRRYFWLYVLCLIPFFFSFLIFIALALLSVLSLGYFLSLSGLILLKPRQEDVI